MPSGKVKWFDRKKKYGFITKDDDGKDIFFHFNGIKDPMLKNIVSSDQKVTFAIIKDQRGERAINVQLVQ
jgi:CspA family cold shock protein